MLEINIDIQPLVIKKLIVFLTLHQLFGKKLFYPDPDNPAIPNDLLNGIVASNLFMLLAIN